jgi:hypothetical protein
LTPEEIKKLLRAMRRKLPHPALTEFRLCKEFGWTLQQLNNTPAKKVEQFLVILGEIDRQAEEEIEKAKTESKPF